MTPEQLKARCRKWLQGNGKAPLEVDEVNQTALESLYREAMAKGLEMAAEIVEDEKIGYAVDDHPYASLQSKMKEQVNKLKEPPCDTSL